MTVKPWWKAYQEYEKITKENSVCDEFCTCQIDKDTVPEECSHANKMIVDNVYDDETEEAVDLTLCVDCKKTLSIKPNETKKKNDKDLKGKSNIALAPMEFLEYTAAPLEIGLLKGYTQNSWQEHMEYSKWLSAALRHLMAWEKGKKGDKGAYTEFHPKTGEPINKTAFHMKAAILNLCRIQWSMERGIDSEDDIRGA